jgi:small subunit ribosomal protein S6
MPLYENVFIARQDVSASQVDTLADEFTAIIQEGGGQITKKEYWGLRNLSFRIKKNRKGHYLLFNIDAPSDAVLEMERIMRLNEDVIRYLTIRVNELEADQSIVLRSRGSRDERGRGGRRFGGPDRGGPRGDRDRRDFKDDRKPAPDGPAKVEAKAEEGAKE